MPASGVTAFDVLSITQKTVASPPPSQSIENDDLFDTIILLDLDHSSLNSYMSA